MLVEPIVENDRTNIYGQNQDIADSTINSDEVIDKTPSKESTSNELEEKDTGSRSSECKQKKEETMDIEELNIISKEVTKNSDETTCGILDMN